MVANEFYFIFAPSIGGLAQLARAFDWQSKGHRFDSDILHGYSKSCNVCCDSFLFCGVHLNDMKGSI